MESGNNVYVKSQRKVVVIGWHPAGIEGSSVTILVDRHGEKEEVRGPLANDAEFDLFFPMDYTGDVRVTVRGSKHGEQTSTIHVE